MLSTIYNCVVCRDVRSVERFTSGRRSLAGALARRALRSTRPLRAHYGPRPYRSLRPRCWHERWPASGAPPLLRCGHPRSPPEGGLADGNRSNPKSHTPENTHFAHHKGRASLCESTDVGVGSLTEVIPGDFWWGRPADLAVKAGVAALNHLQHVQLASEEWLDGGNDFEFGTGGQLLWKPSSV